MAAPTSNTWKLAGAVALLAVAGVMFWRFARANAGDSEKAFFYDLSEQKLFTADRTAVPPIRGLNDAEADGVRAVVVSTNGQPARKNTWRIAYLETYSPELKRQVEAARAAGGSPTFGRSEVQNHRLVKRPTDKDWVSLASPEGEQLVSEWTAWGADGRPPEVCVP